MKRSATKPRFASLFACQQREELARILADQLGEILSFDDLDVVVFKENSKEIEWHVGPKGCHCCCQGAQAGCYNRPDADQLHLETAGLTCDSRGRLRVNEFYQTDIPHIYVYAAADVIGYLALASTSMEQGRLAASHMFQIPFDTMPELFPYGIYTIPEISMVGQTEEALTSHRVPYEVGRVKYSALAKSMMLGDAVGMLKPLFGKSDVPGRWVL